MKMSSESDFNSASNFNESVENDVAGKRLKKAKAQRKKDIQKLKNLQGRTIKKRGRWPLTKNCQWNVK
jgi:hypothetical protein